MTVVAVSMAAAIGSCLPIVFRVAIGVVTTGATVGGGATGGPTYRIL